MDTSPQISLNSLLAAEKPLTPASAATGQHVPPLGSATFRATWQETCLASGRPMLENGTPPKPGVLQPATEDLPIAAPQKLAARSLPILPQNDLLNYSDPRPSTPSHSCELPRTQSSQADRSASQVKKQTAATVKKAVAATAKSATDSHGLPTLERVHQVSAPNSQPIEISCALPPVAARTSVPCRSLTVAAPGSDAPTQHSQTASPTVGGPSQCPQTARGINASQPPHTEPSEPPRPTADTPGKGPINSLSGDTKMPAPSLGEMKSPGSIRQTVHAHDAANRQDLATITSSVQTAPMPAIPSTLLPMQGKVIAHQQATSAAPAPSTSEANHLFSAGPARIEVGVLDSTHGWLKVRAEVGSAGTINTSLTVLSPAHDALHESLPEIANYLHSEGVAVAKIDLHRMPAGAAASEAQPAQTNTAANSGEGERRKDCSSTSGARMHSQSSAGSGDSPAVAPSAALWTRGITRALSSSNPALMMSSGVTGGWVNLCA